jgi:hypothetical protein
VKNKSQKEATFSFLQMFTLLHSRFLHDCGADRPQIGHIRSSCGATMATAHLE